MSLELGTWIGKGLAFGLVGNKCLAEQAQTLKQIRERKLYEELNVTWEQFCQNYLGISRAYADRLIQNLNRYGAAYFRVAEIIQISPQSYEVIEGSITGEQIDIDGELIPITPENAPRIRAAIQAVRRELKASKALRPTCASITDLQFRFDGCFSVMDRLRRGATDSLTTSGLAGLVRYAIDRLKQIENQIENMR